MGSRSSSGEGVGSVGCGASLEPGILGPPLAAEGRSLVADDTDALDVGVAHALEAAGEDEGDEHDAERYQGLRGELGEVDGEHDPVAEMKAAEHCRRQR